MTNYTGIQGQNILIVSSDPANPVEGQIWYNTTSNTLKDYQSVVVNAAWASGGNLNTARSQRGGAGTQTAALGAGGYSSGSSPYNTTAVESYNGSSWTAVASLNSDVRGNCVAGGTNTAVLSFLGVQGNNTFTAQTESWNGSSWTTVGSLNLQRSSAGSAGTQTAALAFGGYFPPPNRNNSESWNGTSWTATPTLNTIISGNAGAGIQTAALSFGGGGGSPSTPTTQTEIWNGTSWTVGPSLGTARYSLAGFGIQTAAVAAGGVTPSATGATELYNGTSWSSSPASLTTARGNLGGTGTQSLGLVYGGLPFQTTTEEWTGPSTALQTKTITTS